MGRQAFRMRPEARDAATILGVAIRTARKDAGWTMARLADAIGASERTVSQIESGAQTVSLGHAFNAAAVLGVPLFGTDDAGLRREASQARQFAALLPARVVAPSGKAPDGWDF